MREMEISSTGIGIFIGMAFMVLVNIAVSELTRPPIGLAEVPRGQRHLIGHGSHKAQRSCIEKIGSEQGD